jgi:3-methyl-2-oxobutanoate hydroxymethyltransferase
MTVPEFQKCKRDGKRLVVVTAYDALFARIIEQAGVEIMLVGDSLGVVVQGKPNTLSVTMEDMLYHTGMVVKGAQRSFVISDMPFMSYQAGVQEAVRNAGRLLQAGAAAVKLEGGGVVTDQVRAIREKGRSGRILWSRMLRHWRKPARSAWF